MMLRVYLICNLSRIIYLDVKWIHPFIGFRVIRSCWNVSCFFFFSLFFFWQLKNMYPMSNQICIVSCRCVLNSPRLFTNHCEKAQTAMLFASKLWRLGRDVFMYFVYGFLYESECGEFGLNSYTARHFIVSRW